MAFASVGALVIDEIGGSRAVRETAVSEEARRQNHEFGTPVDPPVHGTNTAEMYPAATVRPSPWPLDRSLQSIPWIS